MPEQPVNLPLTYFGVFSRAEQRALQAIFKAIAKGGGTCVATVTMLARDSNTSKATTRKAMTQAVEIGLLEKSERRSYCYLSLATSWLREAVMAAHGVGDAARAVLTGDGSSITGGAGDTRNPY